MLTIDIGRLEREGTLRVSAAVPPEDALWEGTDLTFAGPVEVDVVATVAGSGEYVVRGRIAGTLVQECRRCLDEVRTSVDDELTLVFSPADELGSTEQDPEMRVLEPGADEIDLGEAIREELVLDVDRYVVCDAACRGLCPICGVNRNEEECDCSFEEPDPRWDALRELKSD
ncbi:MAG: DUF177 domain-containing protein [Gemmatimonadota bacterium]|jgi:uncharacterized protein